MQIYYPSLIASAICFSAIVVNMHENNFANVLFISLLAIPTVLFLAFLSQKNLDLVAYALILSPIIIVYVGYHMGLPPQLPKKITDINSANVAHVVPDRMEQTEGASCRSCSKVPCVCPVALPAKSV